MLPWLTVSKVVHSRRRIHQCQHPPSHFPDLPADTEGGVANYRFSFLILLLPTQPHYVLGPIYAFLTSLKTCL